jgi:hypothetical protein
LTVTVSIPNANGACAAAWYTAAGG